MTTRSTPLLSFEHLSVPQAIRRTLKVVCSQWLTFFQLAAASLLPFLVVFAGSTATIYAIIESTLAELKKDAKKHHDDHSPDNGQEFEDILEAIGEAFVGLLLIVILAVALSVAVSIVGRAAMIRSTAELYAHNEMRSDACSSLHKGVWQFCELFLAGILTQGAAVFVYTLPVFFSVHGMLMMGIFLAAVAPFLVWYMSIRLSLVYPANVVEESCSGIGGIRRSWELTAGAFCDIWCSKLLLAFILIVIIVVAVAVDGAVADKGYGPVVVLLSLVIVALPTFFFSPCSAV